MQPGIAWQNKTTTACTECANSDQPLSTFHFHGSYEAMKVKQVPNCQWLVLGPPLDL
jgi:hypothetical protein